MVEIEETEGDVCRECGCTDTRGCKVAGVPCCWIEPDLCSSCAPVKQVAAHPFGAHWLAGVGFFLGEKIEQEDPS